MTRNYNEELDLKVKAGIPIIQIISYEWRRIHGMVLKAAKNNDRLFYRWNNTQGLLVWDMTDNCFKTENNELREPTDMLTWFKEQSKKDSILLIEDLHLYFDAMQFREIFGHLRTIYQTEVDLSTKQNRTLVLSQPIQLLPKELDKEIYVMEIPLPNVDTLETVLHKVESDIKLDPDQTDEKEKHEIAQAALGLTDLEAEYSFKEIGIEQKQLTPDEIPLIIERKEQIIRKSRILEYFHPDEKMADVGGLENLKEWLRNRKAGFHQDAIDFGMTPPKGVLLLGVQGCGKSLVAKAIASEWKLPLLKFDLGKVFGGIIGESETNIRKALNVSEAISPSILWIDEIEKGLSGVGSSDRSDAGTTARVFATLLTWMQEKEKPVFVIATANNIEQLPPELLRKGRFDEIFFVDLPGEKSRKEIWEIHLKKRLRGRYKEVKLDVKGLMNKSGGYSGAEIEEAINEGLYFAFNSDREIETKDLLSSIENTVPLSKVMGEKIMNLRKWAKVRARLASDETLEDISLKESKEIPKLKQEASDNPFIS